MHLRCDGIFNDKPSIIFPDSDNEKSLEIGRYMMKL